MRYRILTFILFFSFLSAQAQDILDQKLSVNIENKSADEILLVLTELTGVDISFSQIFFDQELKLSFNFEDKTLGEALDLLLKKTDIQYKVLGGNIVLFLAKFNTVNGYVFDAQSGESLISATVFDTVQNVGVLTNEYGYFSLKVKSGTSQISVSYVGYKQEFFQSKKEGDGNLRIALQADEELQEVIVNANGDGSELYKEDSYKIIDLQRKLIQVSPSLGGEEDYLRTAQILPGVNAGIDGFGGLQVRGGESGQNMMLLDGVTIFIPYHLLGAYSIYNPNTVNSAKLLKGNFPARYGGRISSILDVRTREGNQYKWESNVSSNLINANAVVEGPIANGKGALLFAARYSPTGALFNSFFKNTIFQSDDISLKTNFYDVNAKFNYKLGEKDRIYLSVFNGRDNLVNGLSEEDEEEKLDSEMNFNWSNTIGSLRWNHLFNKKLFSNTTLTYSNFGYELNSFQLAEFVDPDEENEFYLYSNLAQNNEFGISTDFDYYASNKHKFRFGAGLSQSVYALELSYFDDDDIETQDIDEITLEILDSLAVPEETFAIQAHIYAEDQITFNKKWQANLGLRMSYFIGEDRTFLNPEPRLTLHYRPTTTSSWHFSGARMIQYIHLISSAALRLPSDLWLPSSADLSPQSSWQTEIGYEYRFSPKLKLSTTAYYRNMEGLYAYVDSVSFLEDVDEDSTQSFLTSGSGTVWGWETMLSYIGENNGAILSYTLSKSDRLFEAHNLGNSYAHDFDQRHQFKIFGYQKYKDFDFSVNWVYFSANPRISYISLDGGEITRVEINAIGAKNKLRAEAYHRMDINIGYQFSVGKTKHRFKLGAYNIYNRNNIALYEVEEEDDEFQTLPIGSLGILPSFYYSIQF